MAISVYPLLQHTNPTWRERTVDDIAEFARRNADELRECTRAGRFPATIYAEMGRRGWIGTITPAELGGLGGGAPEYCVIGEEVGRHGLVSPQTAVQVQQWILSWGSPEQQRRYLPGIASGAIVCSESISEPDVGSSFKGMQASAVKDGDDWVLKGHKVHVNLGCESHITVFYAIADEGLTSFLVDMSVHGISTTPTNPIGLRLIPTAEVDFENVRVPASALLGAPGQGLDTFLSTFNLSRLGNASELIGFGRRALATAMDYARERRVGGSTVTDFQGIQWTIADSYNALYGASLARDYAAMLIQRGEEHALATTLAKTMAIDAAELASQEVFALVGGHGLYHDEDFLQVLADVKVLRVAGGSKEVLRNYIARRVLGSDTYEGLQ